LAFVLRLPFCRNAGGGPAVNQKLKIIIKSLLLLLYHEAPSPKAHKFLPPILSPSVSAQVLSSSVAAAATKNLFPPAGVANKKPKQFRLTVNCVILFSQ